jgi:hypothetical protein
VSTRVKTRIQWDDVYGMNLRADGMVRQYMAEFTRDVRRLAKVNVRANSKARHRGYPRTGRLAASIEDDKAWANQHGVGRVVYSRLDYAKWVHGGTAARGTGRLYARGRGGRFGGRFPVGAEQGAITVYRASVRGQRPNPFLSDAAKTALRMRGM